MYLRVWRFGLQFFYCILELFRRVIIFVFNFIPTYCSLFTKVLLKFYIISYFVDKPEVDASIIGK